MPSTISAAKSCEASSGSVAGRIVCASLPVTSVRVAARTGMIDLRIVIFVIDGRIG